MLLPFYNLRSKFAVNLLHVVYLASSMYLMNSSSIVHWPFNYVCMIECIHVCILLHLRLACLHVNCLPLYILCTSVRWCMYGRKGFSIKVCGLWWGVHNLKANAFFVYIFWSDMYLILQLFLFLVKNENQDPKQLTGHTSHFVALSQVCPNNLNGVLLT